MNHRGFIHKQGFLDGADSESSRSSQSSEHDTSFVAWLPGMPKPKRTTEEKQFTAYQLRKQQALDIKPLKL